MESLRELYRIGRGPSSSHTMGPGAAAGIMKQRYPDADAFSVILYGSLAKTGRGHLTDVAVRDALAPVPTEIRFDTQTEALPHPNTMDITALLEGSVIGSQRFLSVGGGKIVADGEDFAVPPDIYPEKNFDEIRQRCLDEDWRLWEYVEHYEGPEIWTFLGEVWEVMKASVRTGLKAHGELAGGLHVQRKARTLIRGHHMDESPQVREGRLVCAYAFAVSEENAGGGRIVTAPTCGSCGVVPSVLYYEQESRGFTDEEILQALATAGVIGNIIKTNASISGAECGCQAEIGSACSMAAAALAELFDMELDQIEYAAEVSMEHHLGLTCDPIGGLVQIPCIERNAVAAMRAINALHLANFLTHTRKISFDLVVATMYETGRDLFGKYRETSEGGLAKYYSFTAGDFSEKS
ncbi:MAG: serine dehydratase [Ruminococcaceae bacterium]|nr:serine dehydratase [Oscillospiraceae bacterium]